MLYQLSYKVCVADDDDGDDDDDDGCGSERELRSDTADGKWSLTQMEMMDDGLDTIIL